MKISIIVPVYNEEDNIDIFYKTILSNKYLDDFELEIIFVNDGSSDNTENIVAKLASNDDRVKLFSFTRNFGKEAALCCGLDMATGDAVIPMDVDLQDPVSVVPQLIEKWKSGADVVLAKRVDRTSDSLLKRKTAEWFYSIHNSISTPKIEENVGDFRLMSRSVVDNIKLLQERNVFMKGILSWVGGNKIEIVEYTRDKRNFGKSKFNGWKLWNFALEGITSFSTLPLRIWTYLGASVACFCIFYALYMACDKIINGNDVPGYPSLIVSILFLGGVQLIGIGVLGEYIGRIYLETKHRPRYILR